MTAVTETRRRHFVPSCPECTIRRGGVCVGVSYLSWYSPPRYILHVRRRKKPERTDAMREGALIDEEMMKKYGVVENIPIKELLNGELVKFRVRACSAHYSQLGIRAWPDCVAAQLFPENLIRLHLTLEEWTRTKWIMESPRFRKTRQAILGAVIFWDRGMLIEGEPFYDLIPQPFALDIDWLLRFHDTEATVGPYPLVRGDKLVSREAEGVLKLFKRFGREVRKKDLSKVGLCEPCVEGRCEFYLKECDPRPALMKQSRLGKWVRRRRET